MSNEQLAPLEERIAIAVESLKSSDDKLEIINQLNKLIDERNKKVETLK